MMGAQREETKMTNESITTLAQERERTKTSAGSKHSVESGLLEISELGDTAGQSGTSKIARKSSTEEKWTTSANLKKKLDELKRKFTGDIWEPPKLTVPPLLGSKGLEGLRQNDPEVKIKAVPPLLGSKGLEGLRQNDPQVKIKAIKETEGPKRSVADSESRPIRQIL